jgi:HK97 family phage prohead protease
MADDPTKPYGDVPYADPGYQSDGKKRYPIDTAAHVKAAWSYINQKENAGKYTRPELERIKARIRAAAKKFGIEISDGGEGANSMDVDWTDRAYTDAMHPHQPAGTSVGGQFAPSKSGTGKAPAKKAAAGQKHKPAPHHRPAGHSGTLGYGTGYGVGGGDKRVHRLQEALNRLGLTDGSGNKLRLDGKLGPRTTAAVKKAQKRLGLPQDGKVSPALLDKLAAAKSLPRRSADAFGVEMSDSGRSADYFEEGGGMAAAVERRYTLVPVELRMDGESRRIGGYAAMFDRPSRNLGGFIETVERSFFNKSRGDGWPDVMARYNHDDNMLLGTTGAGTLSLRLDETGLDYLVDPPHSREDVVELVQRGDVRKSSFAFRVPSGGDEWTVSDQGYPLRKLHTGQLVDVAPVNAPAYLDTTAALRSLAAKCSADPEEVRAAAEDNQLLRFFQKTSSAPMPKPKPTTLGASAMVALMARREDPWG